LLWASTSTKNPNYSDVKYIEALIGPDTVNTVPLETLDAYRDHGEPKARLEEDVKEARWVLEPLPELGIGIDNVTRQLEDEGVGESSALKRRAIARWENEGGGIPDQPLPLAACRLP
jgi:transaldolase